jgi:16S rRNA (guanine527-N7)-methyltransferase
VKRLIEGAAALKIDLEPEHVAAFEAYYEALITWNEKFNLTAITAYENAQVRHFLDSLSCLLALEQDGPLTNERVIDVGTGPGFPGLPLKVLRPGLRLTLLEATAKKTRFLNHVVELLDLEKVTVLHGRAEQLGKDQAHRERYDWAIARAVADLPILAEYLLPLTRVGGRALAQKGDDVTDELERALFAIETLGGGFWDLVPVDLPGLDETRHLVILDKLAATPKQYPRRPGMPTKRPITPEA